MTVLDSVLLEEYERFEHLKKMYLDILRDLPNGYLSRKNINGNIYFYLQYREKNKIISQFVPYEQVEELQEQIKKRRHYQKRVKEVEADQKKIRKAVGSLLDGK